MIDYAIKTEDQFPKFVTTLGPEADLARARSVRFYVAFAADDTLVVNEEMTIEDVEEGTVSYAFTAAETARAGFHLAEIVVEYPDGNRSFPVGEESAFTFQFAAFGTPREGNVDPAEAGGTIDLNKLEMLGNIINDDKELIYDFENGYVPLSILEHDALTVAGNTVTLGGSTDVAHGDLVGIGPADHHTRYTDEEAQDAVGLLAGNALAYTDAADRIDVVESEISHDNIAGVSTSDHHVRYTDEEAQDAVGLLAGNALRYTDDSDLLAVVESEISHDNISDVSTSDHHVRYDNEEAQDAVGTILGANFVYDDITPSVTLLSDAVTVAGNTVALGGSTDVAHSDLIGIGPADHHARYTDEEAQDAVGLLAGNALRYTDDTDLLAVVESEISHDNISDVSTSDHHVRYDNEEAQDAVGTILGSNFVYDDVTPSVTLLSDAVTVAGNTVALGGSTDVAHGDLIGIGPSDHHVRYSDEEAQDAIGAMAGNALAYSDTTPSLDVVEAEISHDNIADVSTSDHHIRYDNEEAQDAVGTILGSNFVYDDATPSVTLLSDEVTVAGNTVALGGSTDVAHGDLIGIGSSDHHVRYSDEEAQDAIGAMAGNALAYSDSGPSLDVVESAISHDNIADVSTSDHHVRYDNEEAQDAVGTILGSNFVYDDVTPSVTLLSDEVTVAGNTVALGGATSVAHADLSDAPPAAHHTRYVNEEAQDAVGTILGSNFVYDDATPSVTLLSDEVTVAGSTVALGGTTDISHNNLIGIGPSDHHVRYSDEEAQDAIGVMAGNALEYTDSGPSLDVVESAISHDNIADVSTSDHHVRYDNEEAQDAVGTILGANFVYDDTTPSVTLASDQVTVAGNVVALGGSTSVAHGDLSDAPPAAHHTRYVNEEAQDAVGTILGSNFVYDDTTPAVTLASDQVTVAGNVVALGGSTDVSHSNLIGIGSSDHHVRYADEEAQDAIGAMAGNALAYTDSGPSLDVVESAISHDNIADVSTSDHHIRYDNEEAQDAVGTILGSNFVYDDTTPSVTLASDQVTVAGNVVALGGSTSVAHGDLSDAPPAAHHTRYANEEAQDAVGGILGANFVYDDVTPAVTLASDQVTVAGNVVALGGSTAIAHADISSIGPSDHHVRYSDEEAQDAIGAMAGNALTYTDSGPSLDVVESAISHDNIADVSTSDHHVRYDNEEAQDAVGTILGSNFVYDDVTPAVTLASDQVTVTAGNALSGGGPVALGGSTTLDITADAIGTAEIDEGITPIWTGLHTFNAGLSVPDDTTINLGNTNDASIRWDNANGRLVFGDDDNGSVLSIDNGRMLVAGGGNNIFFTSTEFRAPITMDTAVPIQTAGGGTDSIIIRDSANAQDIAVFNEGGSVTIPSGVDFRPEGIAPDSILIGKSATTRSDANSSVGVGQNVTSDGERSVTLGLNALNGPESFDSVVIGSGAQSSLSDNVIIGSNAQPADGSKTRVTAIGSDASAARDSVAIGHRAFTNVDETISIGSNSSATSSHAIALGHNVTASVQDAIAIRSNATLRYPDNPGVQQAIDFTVDSAPTAGTEQSYSFDIDGSPIATVSAEADGAGGIQNPELQFKSDGIVKAVLTQSDAHDQWGLVSRNDNTTSRIGFNEFGQAQVRGTKLFTEAGIRVRFDKNIEFTNGFRITDGQLNTAGLSSITVRDSANAQDLAVFNEGGPVEFPNTNVDFNGNVLDNVDRILSFSQEFFIRTRGAGGDSVIINDKSAGKDIARFSEGDQLVTIPFGNISWGTDRGAITALDMNVTSTPTAGTEQSYSFDIDGVSIATVFAEADGAGGIQSPQFNFNGSDVSNIDNLLTSGSGTDSIVVRDTANSQDIAQFSEGGNVSIPNGDLQLGVGNGIEFGRDDARIFSSDDNNNGSVQSTVIEANRSVILEADNPNDGFGNAIIRVGGLNTLVANPGGSINIPNGTLTLSSKDVRQIKTKRVTSRVVTQGSGEAHIDIFDDANSQDIARFNEGGEIDIPNGDLTSGDTNGSLELDERSSVADTARVAISRDALVQGYAMVQDVTNGATCLVYLGGPANEVEILHDGGAGVNFTTTEDNNGTSNIYYDATNGQYELNNETGASATYALQILKA